VEVGDEGTGETAPESAPEVTVPDACVEPNPIHKIISKEVLEWKDWFKDGGFETGETEVVINPTANLNLGKAERNQEAARSGSWGYALSTNQGEGVSFGVKTYIEKGEEVRFSFWARSLKGTVNLQPVVLWVELNKEEGPYQSFTPLGEFNVGSEWTQVSFVGFNDRGLRYGLLTLDIGPESDLYLDDIQVEHPQWKMATYPGQTRTVGGIQVPIEPVAPLNFSVLIHMEDPIGLQENEAFFFTESAKFEELARTLSKHGGILNIQAEEDWFLGVEKFSPGLAERFVWDYNVVFSTHTHGPHCTDDEDRLRSLTDCNINKDQSDWGPANDHEYPYVVDYVRAQKALIESIAGISVTDHNGNWEFSQVSRYAEIPMLTLSAFKNRLDQQSFDYLINNPFRPSEVNPLENPEGYLVHDPDTDIVYIPGWGQAITRHEERLQARMSSMFSQFIKHASPDRVNTFYIVTHVGLLQARDETDEGIYLRYVPGSGELVYSDEFLSDINYWEKMLTELIDPLVAEGYVQWASLAEMGEKYIQWEQECGKQAGTEAPSGQPPAEGSKPEGKCGDGVCDGTENETNCPGDCASAESSSQPIPATGSPDYEPPINIMMILHIDPNMDKEAGIFEVTPDVYQMTRDEITWLAEESARHGVKMTSLYNGWYTREALELGDLQQFEDLLAAGHEIGTHAHSLTYDPDQDLWLERIDEVRRYGRPVYDADLAYQSWYEADLYMDMVMEAIGTDGLNQSMCAVPFLCSDEGTMMAELGFKYAPGNRSERGLGLFGHIVWNPFRPGSSDEPGHEIEEDLSADFIAIDHHAQIGTATVAHGMVDTSAQALKRHFLMEYLEWLSRERTGADDKVWTFGFIYHPNYGDRYNDEVVDFLGWLDRYFVGQISPHGNLIARYATVAEVGEEFMAWEAAHPGTSSFSYVAGDPYPYTYEFVPTMLEDALYEARIDLGPGVNCFKLLKSGSPIYLLWSDSGEMEVDFSSEVSGQVRVTYADGSHSEIAPDILQLTTESLFVETLP
jgi:hypothetical protein